MSSLPHEHRLRVRYAETDQMGVAHHASYLIYVEEARTRMMEELGCSYARLEREGIGLPVRRLEMRYRSPARYDDELVVRTRVGSLRSASVRFEYELARADDGSPVASGWTELACVALDAEDRHVVPLPEGTRAQLEAALG